MEAREGVSGRTGKIKWKLSNGTLVISGNGEMPNYESNVSKSWHPYRNFITTVIIENGVTTIGQYAFHKCENLTSILIPKSVTKIQYWAFDNMYCKNLFSINVDIHKPYG